MTVLPPPPPDPTPWPDEDEEYPGQPDSSFLTGQDSKAPVIIAASIIVMCLLICGAMTIGFVASILKGAFE